MNQRTELRLRHRKGVQANKAELATVNEQKWVQAQTVLAFLPLITAAVYLFGMAWHMGYGIWDMLTFSTLIAASSHSQQNKHY